MLPTPFRAMDPDDDLGWHAVADWLEEHDSPERAELVRLTRLLRHGPRVPDHGRHEDRLRELLAAGVEPCVATLTNSIGMEFVYVPPGVFLMGSPEGEEDRNEDEGPMHEVEITRGFWLGRYPLTQAEYESVMGKNPSYFSAKGGGKDRVEGMDTRRFPIENVSYWDALSFCKKMSNKEKSEKRMYRLPTEAEWEYSCRGGGGSKTPFHFGPSLSSTQANFDGNDTYGGPLVPHLARADQVGSYPANGFGLHDMHGNVFEWCSDWYEEGYYATTPAADPSGGKGSSRVIRGGCFNSGRGWCRSAHRFWFAPTRRCNDIGFRVVLVPFESS